MNFFKNVYDPRALDLLFLGNEIWRWVAATALFVIFSYVARALIGFIQSHFQIQNSAGWRGLLRQFLNSLRPALLLVVLAWFAAVLVLQFRAKTERLVDGIALFVVLAQVAVWADGFLQFQLRKRIERVREKDIARTTALGAIGVLSRIVLWILFTILILDNFGINVSTLVAGLGIGGIAIALAVQKILGDLICSISILLDKPFEVGDFITIGNMMGSVEHIGIKSTRIKSLSGEQIVVPNSDLVAGRIQNFKRMQERRVVFVVCCTYDTPLDLVEQIPSIIKDAILKLLDVRFDRSHLRGYGGSGLEFEAVYFVLSGDYNRYMDIQQAINLEIMRKFLTLEIKFSSTQNLNLQVLQPEEANKGSV